MNSINT